MSHPDYEGVKQYVLARLERELSPALRYHTIAHTRDEVVPAAERLAAHESITGEDLLLLCTAAYFHDLGFVEVRRGHELVSRRIAATVLGEYGYRLEQIETIGQIILATRLPQMPHTRLEQILDDADLDLLGRPDFLQRNADLRAEDAAYGEAASDAAWYGAQLAWLESHRYFTSTARALRDATKRQNIQALRQLLQQAEATAADRR